MRVAKRVAETGKNLAKCGKYVATFRRKKPAILGQKACKIAGFPGTETVGFELYSAPANPHKMGMF